MAKDGYGNRTKWTVNELLTRNEQARALGQKGLSNEQIGAAMEGVLAADLQGAAQHEQNLMQHRTNMMELDRKNDLDRDTRNAQTMGGYRNIAQQAYGLYKDYNDPNSLLSKSIEKGKEIIGQDMTSQMVKSGSNIPTEEMYGPNTITKSGVSIDAMNNIANVPGAVWDAATNAEMAGSALDFASIESGLSGAMYASDAWNMVDAASMAAEGITAGTEAATMAAEGISMATDAAAAAASNIPYVGIAIKLAQIGYQLSQGNYAQVLADSVLGPLTMIGSMAQMISGSDFMNKAYEDVNSFLQSPGDSTVICTELYRRGWLTLQEYTLDRFYGAYLGKKGMEGYQKFGIPIANYMKEHDWFAHIVRPFAVHIARKLGNFIKGDKEPWYVRVGRHICRKIGG